MPFEFLRLPREIRDMIYEEYFRLDGGYICDTDAFLKGSLSTSGGGPVDLALVYTCKMVAEETENGNVALSFNTVTFTTIHSPELGDLARLFQKLMFDGVQFVKSVMLNAVGYYLTTKSVSKLNDRYPQSAPLLDRLKDEEPATGNDLLNLARDRQGPYGEAPSVYSEFVDETLRLAADGMSPRSFCLLLDSDGAGGLASQIFESVVHRDAAWQEAWYLFENLPRAVRDIVEGKSVTRYDFDPGTLWDVQELVRQHEGWDEERWVQEWENYDTVFWRTVSPLPDWASIVRDNVICHWTTDEVTRVKVTIE
ncbi:hypothetical protein CMUS01_08454 [Colletotrichum musicola]|uniref:Uncharacterized protein n=1 Tax=Colletotrichum musicola TaxID=2175873 RepID=A0A8H6KCD2_9PEZI|nr:hypothetical protein CMUS01_08454 [Colletotrichum musicola]